MNIRDFYNVNDNKLPAAFEESEYTTNVEHYFGDVLKCCVMAFTFDESSNGDTDSPLQLATGGVGKRKLKNNVDKDQKWSFCSEIQSMTTGLIGLLKFDMAKYLLNIVGIKKVLQSEINTVNLVQNWNELIISVNKIKNIFYLGNDCLSLTENFDIIKYLENPSKCCDNGEKICEYFLADHSSCAKKDVIFTYINAYIKNRNMSKTETFAQVKKYIEEIFNDMLLNSNLRTYEVHSVNDLCINLENRDLCYSPSFLKSFEVYYKEGFGDGITNVKPYEDAINLIINPIINDLITNNKQGFAKQLKKIDTKKMQEKLVKYYKEVFFNIRRVSIESKDNHLLNVNCFEEFFTELSDITIFLIIQIARNISAQLITAKYFGESIRIQFTHFFSAILTCSPHCNLLNKYQRNALYWVLCPKKALEKTLKTFESESQEE